MFYTSFASMSSWKARDGGGKTGRLFCDFKDNSGTFNSRRVNIPGIGEILPLQNKDEDTRTTEVQGLIKLAVNHWRVTKKRVLPVSTLHEWREANHIIRKNLPDCPDQRSTISIYEKWISIHNVIAGMFNHAYAGIMITGKQHNPFIYLEYQLIVYQIKFILISQTTESDYLSLDIFCAVLVLL